MAEVTAREAFNKTVGRVRAVVHRVASEAKQGKPTLETSDRLRGALVLGVAGLDACVSDAITERLPELISKGKQGFRVKHFVKEHWKLAAECFSDDDPAARLVECIDSRILDRETFQDPSNIEDALKGFLGVSVDWDSVAKDLNTAHAGGKTTWTKESSRSRLREIVQRRHKIVHEGDLLPGSLKTRPVKRDDVEEAIAVVNATGSGVLRAAKGSVKGL